MTETVWSDTSGNDSLSAARSGILSHPLCVHFTNQLAALMPGTRAWSATLHRIGTYRSRRWSHQVISWALQALFNGLGLNKEVRA